MILCCLVLILSTNYCAGSAPANDSDGHDGYELLLAKIDNLEYKLLEMQVEMKEQYEALLYNQNRNKLDVLNQTSDILEHQKMLTNHEAIKQSILKFRPKKADYAKLLDKSKFLEDLITINSCEDEQVKESGQYLLSMENSSPLKVYCERKLPGGGWIVVQNRYDGSVDFYRNWTDYRDGFGALDGEFWWGLEKIHQLTVQKPRLLLVFVEDFKGKSRFVVFEDFELGSESEKYVLKKVKRLYGTLDDSLYQHEGSTFTTRDVDSECVRKYVGPWWNSDNCYKSNLNGPYLNTSIEDMKSMNWYGFSYKHECLKISRMMIK